jgi:hypothetical protein
MDGVINDHQAFGPPPVVPPVAPGSQPRRHSAFVVKRLLGVR